MSYEKEGRRLAKQGEHAAAAEQFLKAARFDLAAESFVAAKDHGAAARCFEKAADLEKAAINYVRANEPALAAQAYVLLGRPARAAQMMERAGDVERAAELYVAGEEYGAAGACYERLGELNAAGEMYERAGQLVEAAECFMRTGLFGRAARSFETAHAWARAADAWSKAGDLKRAAANLVHAGDRVGAARAHWTRGDYSEALHLIRNAAPADPDYLEAMETYFTVLAERGYLTPLDEKTVEAFERNPVTVETLAGFLDLAKLYRRCELESEFQRLAARLGVEASWAPEVTRVLAELGVVESGPPVAAAPFEKLLEESFDYSATTRRLEEMRDLQSALDAAIDQGLGLAPEATVRGTTARGRTTLGAPMPQEAAAPPPAPRALSFADLVDDYLFDGRYRIVRKLGAGGIGAVFLARDESLDETVALKVLKPMTDVSDDVVGRFKQEIKITRRIVHPNVVRTYDFGECGSLPYVAMEYVGGRDLKRMLREVGRFSVAEGTRIVRAVCGALAAAHRLDVVHRDIKPQNILIDAEGEVKLIDFGIAKIKDAVTATLTEMFIGTPEYISPEMALGNPVDRRTDVYSVGVVMYEMFCGTTPFRGGSLVSLLQRHVSEAPRPPRELVPELPAALEASILRALAKDPVGRHQDIADLDAELEALSG
ncbi:MAG: protein kinase [bacterium]